MCYLWGTNWIYIYCTLPTQRIYVFRMVLTVNSDYFPTQCILICPYKRRRSVSSMKYGIHVSIHIYVYFMKFLVRNHYAFRRSSLVLNVKACLSMVLLFFLNIFVSSVLKGSLFISFPNYSPSFNLYSSVSSTMWFETFNLPPMSEFLWWSEVMKLSSGLKNISIPLFIFHMV
jgi:hypothetical protein